MNFVHSKTAHAFSMLSLLISIYFFVAIPSERELDFDVWSQSIINVVFGQSTHSFFEIISQLGSKQGIGIVALLFIGWLWWKEKNYPAIAVFVLAIALGNIVNKYIKSFVGRQRPATAPPEDLLSLSFPSGHAMVGFILYFLMAFFVLKRIKKNSTRIIIGAVTGLLVLLVGVSRNVLLAHYPSDVFGGFALGYLWTYAWIIIYEIIVKKERLPEK